MSRFTAKVDVLDLIIQTLQEHERRLDDLAHRLEKTAERLEEHICRIQVNARALKGWSADKEERCL